MAALELGQSFFQCFAVRMIGAGVVVAFIFAELFLHISGGLVDWGDNGPGGRIRLLADVNGVCSETHGNLLDGRGLSGDIPSGNATLCYCAERNRNGTLKRLELAAGSHTDLTTYRTRKSPSIAAVGRAKIWRRAGEGWA